MSICEKCGNALELHAITYDIPRLMTGEIKPQALAITIVRNSAWAAALGAKGLALHVLSLPNFSRFTD